MLNKVITALEESFPVSALYVDAARGAVEESKQNTSEIEIEEMWNDLQNQFKYIKENGLPFVEYCTAFMKVEPYCNIPEIKKRIEQEINNYE